MTSTKTLWTALITLLVLSFALLTLLPLGTLQLLAAIREGYWYARSHEFMQQPLVDLLVWMRVPGDTVFSIGALALALFVALLWLRPQREADEVEEEEEAPEALPAAAE